jgi:hypothetical protein
MGLFGVFRNGTATATATRSGCRMDRLSHANGWTPDAREGNTIAHVFKEDARTPKRIVMITHDPHKEFATFGCYCRAVFNGRSMTRPQLALFLARNWESPLGKWHITLTDGQVRAAVHYVALVKGLDAVLFKTICVALLQEVAFVEEALHNEGML